MRGVPLKALLTPRWLGLVAAVVLLVLACVRLGLWQWSRYEQRDATQALVAANLAQPPVPVGDLLAPGDGVDPTREWRRVTATGEYAADRQVLWRNRPFESRTGAHVLVPLITTEGPDAGTALLVDRGWVPAGGSATARLDIAPPPAGPVIVTARVRAGEPVADTGDLGLVGTPQRSVLRLDPARVAAAVGAQPAYPGFAELIEEGPSAGASVAAGAGTGTPPALIPPPQASTAAVGQGANLSYALQWFCFGVIAIVGVVVLARRELDDLRARRAGQAGRAGRPLTRT